MNGKMYIVWVDGFFAGATEDEDYVWDIVADTINGVSAPLIDDDIPDRVEINKIDVNRYEADYHNVCDKLSDFSFLCRGLTECEKALEHMNKLQLETERAEAKLRALAL